MCKYVGDIRNNLYWYLLLKHSRQQSEATSIYCNEMTKLSKNNNSNTRMHAFNAYVHLCALILNKYEYYIDIKMQNNLD